MNRLRAGLVTFNLIAVLDLRLQQCMWMAQHSPEGLTSKGRTLHNNNMVVT